MEYMDVGENAYYQKQPNCSDTPITEKLARKLENPLRVDPCFNFGPTWTADWGENPPFGAGEVQG